MNIQKLILLVTSLMGILAAFMPWASLPLIGAISGFSGDGKITAFLFLLSVPVLLFDRGGMMKHLDDPIRNSRLWILLLLNFSVALIMSYKVVTMSTKIVSFISMGFWLTLILSMIATLFIVFRLFTELRRK